MKTFPAIAVTAAALGFGLAPAALRAQALTTVANAAAVVPPPALTPAQISQLPPVPAPAGGRKLEYILLTGGPSLIQWEKYKAAPHDQFWGSFARATRTRIQQLQAQLGNNPDVVITWLVYVEGYRERAKQEKQDLVSNLLSVRDKYHVNMVPIANGRDVLNYLNNGGPNTPRDQVKIADLEFFGHSNRACFMFDYSSNVDSASKAFLHEDELAQLKRNLFVRNAYVKSWGCHTGESMSAKFKAATGTRMIGAIGRTDFSSRDEALNGIIPVLSSQDGKWTQ